MMAGSFQLHLITVLGQLTVIILGQRDDSTIPCPIDGHYWKTDKEFSVSINSELFASLLCTKKSYNQYDCTGQCFGSPGKRFNTICYREVSTRDNTIRTSWVPPFYSWSYKCPDVEEETTSRPESEKNGIIHIPIIITCGIVLFLICTFTWSAKIKRRRKTELQRRVRRNNISMIFAATLPYGPGEALEQTADSLNSTINRSILATTRPEGPPPYTCDNEEVVISPPSYSEAVATKQETFDNADCPPPYSEIKY